MTEVIRCERLTKRYGSTTAVDGLDLSVTSGQVFGFLGPNGAGKTTTMRILLGLIRPTSGRAWLNGRQVPDPAGLASVGAMIEEPAFYPWLTGRRNLEVLALTGPPLTGRDGKSAPAARIGSPPLDRGDRGPAGAGADRAGGVVIDAVLDQVGLGDVADRKVKAYSQGMRQRLGLAVALLRKPALLLLDEPANGMDPAGIKEFRTLLRSLAGDGTTVFLSSHLLAEAEQVCDQVAVLAGGRLVEQGSIADLSAPRPRVRVVVDPADQPAALNLLARWPLRADGADGLVVEAASGREVNQALAAGGIWADQIRPEHADLEEAFLQLTETTAVEESRAIAAR